MFRYMGSRYIEQIVPFGKEMSDQRTFNVRNAIIGFLTWLRNEFRESYCS
jgi:ribosomal protein S17E